MPNQPLCEVRGTRICSSIVREKYKQRYKPVYKVAGRTELFVNETQAAVAEREDGRCFESRDTRSTDVRSPS